MVSFEIDKPLIVTQKPDRTSPGCYDESGNTLAI